MKRETITFLSNVSVGTALGIILDYFVKTSFVFTIIGLIAGVVLAMIIKKRGC